MATDFPVSFACLYVEANTADSEDGPKPWCFDHFRKLLRVDPPDWPKDGLIPALQTGFYDGDQHNHERLKAFLNEFATQVKNQASLTELRTLINTSPNSGNMYADGAQAFTKFFSSKFWPKTFANTHFDRYLSEQELLPWQRSENLGLAWNPTPKKEKGCLQVSSSAAQMADYYPLICEYLFGDQPLPEAYPIALAVLGAAYGRAYKRGRRQLSRVEKLDKEIEGLEGELNQLHSSGSISENRRMIAEKVSKLIKLYGQQSFLKQIFVISDQKEQLSNRRDELRSLLDSLKEEDDEIDIDGLESLSKTLRTILKDLADEDSLRDIEDAYVATFGDGLTLKEFEEEQLLTPDDWLDADGDLGVEEFKALDESQLNAALGLPESEDRHYMPFMNRWRHEDGLLPSKITNFQAINDDGSLTAEDALKKHQLLPIRPFWHQLVGVAAAIKRGFNGSNVLFADAVGVGKTMQAFMIICLLRFYKLQATKQEGKWTVRLPPAAESGEKWGWNPSAAPLPSGHILIVVPPLLVKQWAEEAQRFLDTRLWNIIVYPTKARDRKAFWSRVWEKKVGKGGLTTILVAASSSIIGDLTWCWSVSDKKVSRLYGRNDGPYLHDTKACNTVFSQTWGMVVLDEAHVIRTEGKLLKAIIALRVRTASLILMTATPLFNAERDLVSLGIALGVEKMEELVELEKELKKDLARLKKQGRINEPSTFVNDTDVLEVVLQQQEEVIRNSPKTAVRKEVVTKMRKAFGNVIIRRTMKSNGLLNGLLNAILTYFDISMRPEEEKVFEEIKKGINKKLSNTANVWDVMTEHFFNEYRTAIGNIGARDKGKPHIYTSQEDFRNRAGAKWQLLVDLLLCLMRHDGGPFPCRAEDGTMQLPSQTCDESTSSSTSSKSKIVIYVEIVKTVPALVKSLELFNIGALVCTGNGSQVQRNRVLQEFRDPKMNHRVLILSSIGSAGLNLHQAQHLIFADMVWSAQMQEQIIGRVCRQPNTQQVYVWLPRVIGTSDMKFHELAHTKKTLLDTFLNTMKAEPDSIEEYHGPRTYVEEQELFSRKKKPRLAKLVTPVHSNTSGQNHMVEGMEGTNSAEGASALVKPLADVDISGSAAQPPRLDSTSGQNHMVEGMEGTNSAEGASALVKPLADVDISGSAAQPRLDSTSTMNATAASNDVLTAETAEKSVDDDNQDVDSFIGDGSIENGHNSTCLVKEPTQELELELKEQQNVRVSEQVINYDHDYDYDTGMDDDWNTNSPTIERAEAAELGKIAGRRLAGLDIDKIATKLEIDVPIELDLETGLCIGQISMTLNRTIRGWFTRSLTSVWKDLKHAADILKESTHKDLDEFSQPDPGPILNLSYAEYTMHKQTSSDYTTPSRPIPEVFQFLEAYMAYCFESPILPWLVYNRKRRIVAELGRLERAEAGGLDDKFIFPKAYLQLSEVVKIRQKGGQRGLPPWPWDGLPANVQALLAFGEHMERQVSWPIQHTSHFKWLTFVSLEDDAKRRPGENSQKQKRKAESDDGNVGKRQKLDAIVGKVHRYTRQEKGKGKQRSSKSQEQSSSKSLDAIAERMHRYTRQEKGKGKQRSSKSQEQEQRSSKSQEQEQSSSKSHEKKSRDERRAKLQDTAQAMSKRFHSVVK